MPKFVHIVLWKLKDDPSAVSEIEHIKALKAPGRLVCEMGSSIVSKVRNAAFPADFGLYSIFESEEAYQTYAASEEHVSCAADHVKPFTTGSIAFDWVMPE